MEINSMKLPKLDFFVNDFSGEIPQEKKTKYNNLFSEHQNTSGEQITTVFIKHRNGNELKDIALKVFNENGVGDKETNNGLLLIVVTEEKKIRIMTGKGMEIEFSDEYCKEIIESELRPLLNNGDYDNLLNSWYEISTKKRGIKTNNNINYNGDNQFNPKGSIYNNGKLKNQTVDKIITILFSLFFLSIIIIFFIIVINIIGYSGNSSNSSSSSSSDWSSSSSSDWSSSSSSDWGGGSSNGGGYGD